jgi:hypothetical protein
MFREIIYSNRHPQYMINDDNKETQQCRLLALILGRYVTHKKAKITYASNTFDLRKSRRKMIIIFLEIYSIIRLRRSAIPRIFREEALATTFRARMKKAEDKGMITEEGGPEGWEESAHS